MNQPKDGVWGPRRGKGLLIIIVVVALAVVAGVWASAMATSPPSADAVNTTSGATNAAAEATAGPGTGTVPGPTMPSVPPASVPPATTLPPSQAAAKEKKDAANALVAQPTAAPIALTVKSKPQAGVTASVGKIEAIKGEGQGPGQISGPAIRFTITLVNAGATAVLTDKVVVNVESGPDAIPAIQLTASGASPFPESTAPGKTSTGTFVFLLPNDQRDKVRIFFNYQVSSPIVAFEGAVPKGQ